MSEIQKFTDDILNVANEKAGLIVSKAQNETQQVLEEARSSYGREATEIVKNAQSEAEAIKRRQVSEARHRVKLREQEEKNRILSDVLDQTKKRASQFADDEERYVPYLTKLIVSGIDELDLDNATLHLNARDLKRFDRKLLQEVHKQLRRPVKVEMAPEPINCASGVVISSSDGKVRIDNTVEQRFEALESELLIEAGKLLFG
jgi:vacuolar-type H+-ATPase subunit E/Vma4